MKTNAKVYVMVDGEGRIKLGHSVNPAARSKQMPRPVTLVHETDAGYYTCSNPGVKPYAD